MRSKRLLKVPPSIREKEIRNLRLLIFFEIAAHIIAIVANKETATKHQRMPEKLPNAAP